MKILMIEFEERGGPQAEKLSEEGFEVELYPSLEPALTALKEKKYRGIILGDLAFSNFEREESQGLKENFKRNFQQLREITPTIPCLIFSNLSVVLNGDYKNDFYFCKMADSSIDGTNSAERLANMLKGFLRRFN